jgi:hypothetical protein
MKRSAVQIVVFVAACSVFCANAQTYYEWKDASGVSHYSDQPPEHGKARVIKPMHGQSVPAMDKPVAAATAAKADPGALERAQETYERRACESSRADLALLDSGKMVLSGDSAADAHAMNADDRAAARKKAEQAVAQNCKAGTGK